MVFGTGTTGATYKKGKAWRRVTAILVVLVFTLFDAGRYAPQGYASPAAPIADPAPTSFSIPKELGKVEESFRGTTDKTVIFIQDAHDSLEAQENIAKLIGKFVKEKGIKTVFEEGYEGPVPTDKFFGFIKDHKTKQKVSYFLLDKLRIGGAEYAHINRANDFNLIGVEDLKLYGENIKCYQKSSASRKDIEADLRELFGQITTLANQHFPKDLKTWLKWKKLFSEGELPLLNYLNELRGLFLKSLQTRSARQFSKEYPAISILLMAQTVRNPALIKQLNALDSKVVFSEITQLENNFSNALLQNEPDQQIFVYYQSLCLLKRLNRIELTQVEYETAKEALRQLDTQKLADFIVSLTHRSLVLSKEWEQHIKDAVRFYDVAQGRDKSIDSHLKEFLQNKEEYAAILVFGGFHANGIKEIMKQQGLSFIVISPKITSTDKKHQDYYQQLMSGAHHSFETPFIAAHANKPPSAFFMATTAGDLPVEQELHAITSSVEILDDNADSQLIERRLADFKQARKYQAVHPLVGSSKIRSEMRSERDVSQSRTLSRQLPSILNEIVMCDHDGKNKELDKAVDIFIEWMRDVAPALAEQYDKEEGVWEGYSLREHTIHVIRQFKHYFLMRNLPNNVPYKPTGLTDGQFIILLLLLHDIGKPLAGGSKEKQNKATADLVRVLFKKLGYGAESQQLVLGLIGAVVHDDAVAGYDPLGGWIKGKDSLDVYAGQIHEMAQFAGMEEGPFFDLLTLYYQCDSSSYTADSGGMPSLDRLYKTEPAGFEYIPQSSVKEWGIRAISFNEANKRLDFEDPVENKFVALENVVKNGTLHQTPTKIHRALNVAEPQLSEPLPGMLLGTKILELIKLGVWGSWKLAVSRSSITQEFRASFKRYAETRRSFFESRGAASKIISGKEQKVSEPLRGCLATHGVHFKTDWPNELPPVARFAGIVSGGLKIKRESAIHVGSGGWLDHYTSGDVADQYAVVVPMARFFRNGYRYRMQFGGMDPMTFPSQHQQYRISGLLGGREILAWGTWEDWEKRQAVIKAEDLIYLVHEDSVSKVEAAVRKQFEIAKVPDMNLAMENFYRRTLVYNFPGWDGTDQLNLATGWLVSTPEGKRKFSAMTGGLDLDEMSKELDRAKLESRFKYEIFQGWDNVMPRSEMRMAPSFSEGKLPSVGITGASGDLGAMLGRYVDSKGHFVNAVVRSDKSRQKYKDRALRDLPDDRFLLSDIFNREKMRDVIAQSTVFYHLAALVGLDKDTGSYPENFKVNGLAAIGLLKMAEELNPTLRFIFASTQRVYGIEQNSAVNRWIDGALEVINENSALFQEKDYSSAMDKLMALILVKHPFLEGVYPYELAKLLVERYMQRSALKNSVAVRISSIYGPGNLSGRKIQRMIESRLLGQTISEKREIRDYIYIQDAIEILYQLGVKKDVSGQRVVDVASGSETAAEEIWDLIVKHTPEAKGRIAWKGDPIPANPQSNKLGREMLERDFTHIETGIRNQIDEARWRLFPGTSSAKGEGPVLVIDAGGTSTRMGVWAGEKLTDQIKFPTINYVSVEAQGKPIDQMQEIWLESLAQKILEYQVRHPHIQSIAMGFAGPVGEEGDLTESAVIWGPNRHKISNAALQKKWGLPVKVVNDLTAAVYRYGRSQKFAGMRTIALITVSSGIGSKLFDIVHGNVVIDRQGRAGEIGHTVVDYAGNAIPGEGLKGELNAYASGRGLSNLAKRLARQKKFKVPYERSALKTEIEKAGQTIETIDRDLLTRLLVEAIKKKDGFSLQVMKTSITYLVRVLGPFILQNAPDAIVWMGSIAEHLETVYLDEVIDQLLSKGLYGYTRDDLKKMFVMGEKDDENGLRGAGLMVFDKHGEATEQVVHNPGYVRDSVDPRGHEMIEAVAPNDLQQRNYFTEGAFDVGNPILADVLEKRNVIFVVEKAVADKVLEPLKQYIRHHHLEKSVKGEIQVLDGGEKIKSDEQVKNLTDYAQDQKLDRNGIFVVVGGGAVMDMVGMVANQFRRGVRYVRIPTTLLAQVDAAVGVKVGIDYRTAKNFLGAFYPPFATITDTRFLETLPERQIQGGIAEIIKVALISNPSLFEILEKYGTAFIHDMPKDEEKAFIRDAAVELLKHLQMDFFERNLMRHVDFGHVLAHKFESMTNYELTHGEAVAIDILMSSYIARERGLLSDQDFQRILALHAKLKLPFYHPALNPNLAWDGLEEAKAHKGGRLMMVVPIGIGRTTFIDSLRRDELDAALDFLRRHQERDDEELMIHEISEDHPPVELRYLQQYLESLPLDPTYYLTEISDVLKDLLGPSIQMIINVATNQNLDPGTRAKAAEMLAKCGLHTDYDWKVISLHSLASPNLKNIKFKRYGGAFVPDLPVKVQTDEAVAHQLLDKEAFVFDIDGTLISGKLDPEIVELIIGLLKQHKTVAFATVRGLTLEDYYAHIRKGEGLGILKNIFEHPDFKPEMLSRIFAYTGVASYKYAFRMKSGRARSGWFNIEPVLDKKYSAKYLKAKTFSEAEAARLKEIKTAFLETENGFSKEYGFANPDQDYEGFVRGAKIQEDEKAILYFPRTKQGEIENWKLRNMLQKLRTRLAEKSPAEFVKGLAFRVVWRKGILIAKQENRKNEALLDLEAMGFARNRLCFFGDDIVADGLDRLVTEIPGLMVVSTAAPIPGDVSMSQIEPDASKSGPDRVKRILKAYFNLAQQRMARSEARFTDVEVKSLLANWMVEGHWFNPAGIQPVSLVVFLNEAESLGSANPEWVLRSILGKTSREKLSAEEVELFLYQGKVRPVSILYQPRIRPGDIQHSNRLKKGVPVTSSNHPISPAVAESLAAALIAKMRSRIDLSEHARKSLRVLGKYTGSLVLGSLVANLLKLPFVTLTKRPYVFDLPPDKQWLKYRSRICLQRIRNIIPT
jgi:3-dehydroquinate synthase